MRGKSMMYISKETKGSLIEIINKDIPEPEKKILMSETGLRFITYDQAIQWLIEKLGLEKKKENPIAMP